MSGTFTHKGIPSGVVFDDKDSKQAFSVEDGLNHHSVNKTWTGELTNFELITPPSGCYLILKGITILGSGNSGIIKVLRGSNGNNILPCYFSNFTRSTPSGAFNLVMNIDEKVLITSTDRGSGESFVGVSYLICDPKANE